MEKHLTYHNITNQVLPYAASKVQKQLDDIKEYAHLNEMKFNRKKSKAMLFITARKHDFTPTHNVDNELLEVVEEIKLLGVKISNDLKWDSNTKYGQTIACSRL